MGTFFYGTAGYAVEIDDRPLAHLKIAMLSLLRAGTSVAFSFHRGTGSGSGRETLWISPTTEVRFLFLGDRPPRINEPWVRRIIETSATATGFRMVDELDPSTASTSGGSSSGARPDGAAM